MAQPAGLPAVALTLVLARLPVDTRLRCAEVCREWRAAVTDPALWTRLDLSFPGSGVSVRHTPALLAAAFARAGGRAEHLGLSGCAALVHPLGAADDDVPLLPLLRLHGAALRTLRVTDWLVPAPPDTPDVQPSRPGSITLRLAAALRAAAPALRELHLDVGVPLQTRRGALDDTAAALEALARVATPALRVLSLRGRLQGRDTWGHVRLLGRHDEALRADASAALERLREALGGVAELTLRGFDLLAAPARAAALVRAAAASDRLAALDLSGGACDDHRPPDAELADFCAACAEVTPRLRSLHLADCSLPSGALEPLLAAVGNAPLLTCLSLDGNTLGAAFCASLLPAVEAAAALKLLRLSEPGEAARRAEVLVWRRKHGLAASSVDTPAFGTLFSAADLFIEGHFEERSHSVVYRGRCNASGDLVAVKKLPVAENEGDGICPDTVLHLALLSRLRHPAIVAIRGVRLGGNKKAAMLVRDGAPHCLNDVVRSELPLPLARVLALGSQLCSAVAHCHAAGVLHCHLSPYSALVGPGDALFLTSLDYARSAKRHPAERNQRTVLWYAAPELLLGDVATTAAEDIWSLGATLFELCVGKPLASAQETWTQLLDIGEVCGSAVASGWAAAAHLPDFRSVQGPAPGRRVRQSMRTARPDLTDADSEAFIQLVDSMLCYDPALRPSSADVASHPAFNAYRALHPPQPPASVAAASAAWGAAPDGAPDSVAARVPLLTAAQLAASPARRDGMASPDEAAHHRHVITLLRRLAADLLHPPPDDDDADSEAKAMRTQDLHERAAIVASASVFLLRFYAVHSRALRLANPPLPAAAAALLLACKARERAPALCTAALARATLALRRNAPVPPAGEDEAADADVAQLRDCILDAEWRMAVALCFVFSVDTPCEWLHRAMRNGGVSEIQLTAALEIASRIEETDAALRFPGATIAACALALNATDEALRDAQAVGTACVAIGVHVPSAAEAQEALAHVSAAVQCHVAAPEAVLREHLPPPPGVARRVAQAESPHWWPPRPTPRDS